jgi:hypothetical protein
LEFKHVAVKETGLELRESRLIVQALRALGKDHVSQNVIRKISDQIGDVPSGKILKDVQKVSVWIYKAIEEILKERNMDNIARFYQRKEVSFFRRLRL